MALYTYSKPLGNATLASERYYYFVLHCRYMLFRLCMEWTDLEFGPDGCGEHEKVERIGYSVICGVPMTLTVNGLMVVMVRVYTIPGVHSGYASESTPSQRHNGF